MDAVVMSPLLTTKLHPPRRRRGLVPRPRLAERLDRGRDSTLTLVSAPAGFGKSTVLTEWLAAAAPEGRAGAWLSLDARDNDPTLFWSYVVAALQTAVPEIGVAALASLRSPHASPDAALATLVNELAELPAELVLVLDDYHVIDSPQVHDGLAFLVEHLPAQVQLVIAGRADPPLPLARLRGRGELVELRAADLRFTPDEVATYLTDAMGLALSSTDVAVLDSRTEGWIAALQLAALSMQGRDDATGFVAEFAGDDRYIVDYLVEEVLQRQPQDVRAFLLQTSVLTRLTGALCDAVVGRDGGTTVLETLDRANLFLVPLDDRRRWYRYHHLFADVLQARLLAEQPELVVELHRRAGAWHATHGEPSEAIRHALAGGDAERAADLVELAMPAARRNRQETTLRHWFRQLPEAVLRNRPVLRAGYAGAILVHGELDGVEEHLRDAERWLEHPDPDVDAAVVRTVRSQVAVYRAAQSRMTGDSAGASTHARRVLEFAATDDHLVRGAAAGLLGLTHWSDGDLGAAHRWWSEAHTELGHAGHHSDTLGVALALADISIARGRLREAQAIYRRGLATAAAHASTVLRGAADMHVGLSELAREGDDLATARRHLAASTELGEHAGLPQNRHRSLIAMARIHQAEGDLDGAVELLDEAERNYDGDMFPDVRPIAALRARVRLAQGRIDEALSWVRERRLSSGDPLTYLREFEHVTLARTSLAQYEASGDQRCMAEAKALLQRLLDEAEQGERTGSVIEIAVLLALARRADGDLPGALASLDRSLTLAEPEDYVRVFLDEGPEMTSLLQVLASREESRPHVRRLLHAGHGPAPAAPVQRNLVEPLSARELDVLRLLDTDLDGPDIARRLFVSVNTVRTHTKNLYAKLGVNNRRAAVRRGRELDLLTPFGDRTTPTAP